MGTHDVRMHARTSGRQQTSGLCEPQGFCYNQCASACVTLIARNAELGRQRDGERIHDSCQTAEICKTAQVGHVRGAAAAAQAAFASCSKGGGEAEAAIDEGAAEEDLPPTHAISNRSQRQA